MKTFLARAGAVAAVLLGLYESARVTVRLPLAVPVALIGVVLLVIALAFRRPPSTPGQTAQSPRPAAERPDSTWKFDDVSEESW